MKWCESESFGGCDMETYVLLFKSAYDRYAVTFTGSYHDCMSGWTSATSYTMSKPRKLGKFEHFGALHYVPKADMCGNLGNVKDKWDENTWTYNTDTTIVFTCSPYGSDCYYPSGSFDIDLSLFRATRRCNAIKATVAPTIETVPAPAIKASAVVRDVYVFSGPSLMGKSHVASLMDATVYETDVDDAIPDTLFQNDVIVVGNKFKGQLIRVMAKLEPFESGGNIRVIKVAFSL